MRHDPTGAPDGREPGLDASIHLHGTLGSAHLLVLADELSETLSLQPAWLIVDLSNCTGLHPRAVDLLREAQRLAARYGGRLVLRDLDRSLTRALGASGLLAHVPVEHGVVRQAS